MSNGHVSKDTRIVSCYPDVLKIPKPTIFFGIFSLVITGQISSHILHMSGCLAMITEWLQLMPNLSTMQHPMYCSLKRCSPGSSVDCLYKKPSKGVWHFCLIFGCNDPTYYPSSIGEFEFSFTQLTGLTHLSYPSYSGEV